MTYEEFLQQNAELLKQYIAYSARADPAELTAFNKVKEVLGEQIADVAISEKYGERAPTARAVPLRGERGAPMLDRVYELAPGKELYAAGDEFLIVDAKFGASELGKTNFNRRMLVETRGKLPPKMTSLPLKKQVEQLDADWIRARVKEIAKRELANGVALEDSLAAQLDRALAAGKVRVLEVRSSIDLENGLIARINHHVIDHTSAVAERYRGGSRPPKDAEARFASAESLDELYLKRAAKTANADRRKLEGLQDRLATAEERALTSEAKLSKVIDDPSTKAKARARVRKKQLAENQRRVGELKQATANASAAAQQSETHRASYEEQRDRSTAGREAEARAKRLDAASAAVYDRGLTSEARAVKETAVADRAVGHTVTVAKAPAETAARTERVVVKGADLVKAGDHLLAITRARPLRSVARFTLRGSKMLVTGGKFVFRVVEFANPVLDVLMLVDAIDWLVDWLQREKKEEQAEWRRIAHLMSAPSTVVRLEPYGTPYTDGYGPAFSSLVERTLAGAYGHGTVIDWLQKWDLNRAWSGFVYATATAGFERQESDDDYAYNVAYYPASPGWDVRLSDQPPPNSKKQLPQGSFGDADPRNQRVPKRGADGQAAHYFVDVEISSLDVRYTFPDPVLTPFDFILAKCRGLIGEIAAFLAKYDDRIMNDMVVGGEIVPGFASGPWLEDHSFDYPLYDRSVRWCLKAVDAASLLLSTHNTLPGDERRPNPVVPLNFGYFRRSNILRELTSPRDTTVSSFATIARELPNMLQSEDRKYLLDPKDRRADYLTRQRLYDVAWEIDEDVKRAHDACAKPARQLYYNYDGPPSPT